MDMGLLLTVIVLIWQQHYVTDAADTLYGSDDQVVQLDVHNFDRFLIRKPHGWVVEFYATWCGHCQHFAPIYKEFAKDITGWSKLVRVAAIACSEPANLPVCRGQNVRGFPSVKFFPPNMNTVTRGFTLTPLRFHVSDVRSSTLQFVENYVMHSPGSFPSVAQFGALEGLLEEARTKESTHVFIIVEEDQTVNSELAKTVIMDMSSDYPRILIGRLPKSAILDQESLWQPLPSVVSVGLRDNRLRFVTQLNTRQDVTRMIRTLSSEAWRPDPPSAVTPLGSIPVRTVTQPPHNDRESVVTPPIPTGQEIPLVIPLQTTTGAPNTTDTDYTGDQTPGSHLHFSPALKMAPTDMDSNIYYMLWNEVASRERLRGGALSALKHYLAVLSKYHPSQPRLHSFLDTVYGWMKLIGGSLDSTLYLNTVDGLQTNDSHVLKELVWSACAGSEAHYRGYPCSLWMTFHALTVAAYEHHIQYPQEPFDPMDVLSAIRSYVRHFLGCRECAKHFQKMARHMEEDVSRPEDGILWLWWGHNRVNTRLHGDQTEDPSHPKIQFPSPAACPACRQQSDWNITAVLDYLRRFYAVENILGQLSSSASLTMTSQPLPTSAGSLNRDGEVRQESADLQTTEQSQQPKPWNVPLQDPRSTQTQSAHGANKTDRAIRNRTVPPSRPTAAPSLHETNSTCVARTSAWSACTVSCNAGIATRMSNANTRCEMELEARVCQIRPCSFSIGNPRPGREQCTANMRSETRMTLTFNGCTTNKAYRWRFCNRCHGYCCKPANDGTFWADVTCHHGDEVVAGAMQISWIVSCSCTLGSCDDN